ARRPSRVRSAGLEEHDEVGLRDRVKFVLSSNTKPPGVADGEPLDQYSSSRRASGSFTIRCNPNRSPLADRRTITERRRWKSTPTYCRSIGAFSLRGSRCASPESPTRARNLHGERR